MALLHIANAHRVAAPGRTLIDLLVGILAGCALVGGFVADPKIGIALAVAVIALPFLLLRPASLYWMALIGVLLVEEFPAGLGEVTERAMRTPFYATSAVVPGLYLPDLLLSMAVGLVLLERLIGRRPLDLVWDRSAKWLVLLTATLIVSVVMAFVRENPLDIEGPQLVLGANIEINERAAKLIAFFQFKSFSLIMLAYLATLLYVRDDAGLRLAVRVVGGCALVVAVTGTLRLLMNPQWVLQNIPLYSDSISSLMFSLIAFYVVAAWSQDMLGPTRTLWLTVLSGVMMLLLLVSFRRTMWGATVLASLPVLAFMPAHKRNFLLLAGVVGAFVLGGAVLLSPAGAAVIEAVSNRLGQTSSEDASSEYRFVLFRYFGENFLDIPLFGHGPKPFWDALVTQGQFQISLENIHSLYFWLWLRLGHVGLAVFVIGVMLVMAQAWGLGRRALEPRYRVLALMILLYILMFLFNGLFNPAYGQSRGVLLMGVALGLLSRVLQQNDSDSRTRHAST
ncbi:MAG: O-antigen ligase family protein [Panacagrimonas sp.]